MPEFDPRSYAYPSRRNVVYARKAMACTSIPQGAQIGLDVMKAGGNAMDAAVAMAAAMPLLEPTSNGLGSDCFALVWVEAEKKLYGLNASGVAPAALSAAMVREMGHQAMPKAGWIPTMVPGAPAGWAELNRRFPRREGYVFPGTVLRKLGARLDDDAVVCVDVGQNQIFTCKYLPQKNGRLLTSGGLGTMGYALPAAVGAKVACPERQTIVVCGDGSFQMAMNELAAVRAGGLDLKIVLFRNHTLGLVHQIQCSAPYHGPFGVALDGSPDFETIAQAYGIPSLTVRDEDRLDGVLDQFLAAPGCGLLICEVHPDVGTND